jgi:hypothetical protein
MEATVDSEREAFGYLTQVLRNSLGCPELKLYSREHVADYILDMAEGNKEAGDLWVRSMGKDLLHTSWDKDMTTKEIALALSQLKQPALLPPRAPCSCTKVDGDELAKSETMCKFATCLVGPG